MEVAVGMERIKRKVKDDRVTGPGGRVDVGRIRQEQSGMI